MDNEYPKLSRLCRNMYKQKQAALEYYEKVPLYIRQDICEATQWARTTLTDHEGSGHYIQILAENDLVVCCFSKPSWSSDFCGSGMGDGAESIVTAVSEYLCGM